MNVERRVILWTEIEYNNSVGIFKDKRSKMGNIIMKRIVKICHAMAGGYLVTFFCVNAQWKFLPKNSLIQKNF